ncbi:IS110 family transposase [Streptomyces carpinensis]|uniref:Transposase n=1 Tax=Streptomyces carpinensis TaxID=66369 RepID=A0ABV1VX90_9ACTN|nr:IS110 family transposase [Streptomyces carpinensis]
MTLLGVDPHKSTHTATAVEAESNQQVGTLRIEASLTDYRRLLAWAKRWPQRKWAVENANGLGRHLAQWLIARGESVVDVPAAATSRARELSRGGRRKNDQIDAAAAATVACLQGDGRDVEPEDHTTALALLDERRVNLAQARVRTVNQLHALLRDLLPGGAPTQLSADLAAKLLRSVRPAGDVETARKVEVPLPTPFLAITKIVMERVAEQQYDGVVQASRIQPRMTRAALKGGAQAVVRELAVSTGTDVLYLDQEGTTRAAHPPGSRTPELLTLAGPPPPQQAAASVTTTPEGVAAVH